jgi:hypothetical protein
MREKTFCQKVSLPRPLSKTFIKFNKKKTAYILYTVKNCLEHRHEQYSAQLKNEFGKLIICGNKHKISLYQIEAE